jgi:hypothetical protein
VVHGGGKPGVNEDVPVEVRYKTVGYKNVNYMY